MSCVYMWFGKVGTREGSGRDFDKRFFVLLSYSDWPFYKFRKNDVIYDVSPCVREGIGHVCQLFLYVIGLLNGNIFR